MAAVAVQSPRAMAAALQRPLKVVVGTMAAVAVQSPRAIAAALQKPLKVEAELDVGTTAAVAVQSPRAMAAALQNPLKVVVGTIAAVAVQSPRAMAAALQMPLKVVVAWRGRILAMVAEVIERLISMFLTDILGGEEERRRLGGLKADEKLDVTCCEEMEMLMLVMR